jgi:hypothetical protein
VPGVTITRLTITVRLGSVSAAHRNFLRVCFFDILSSTTPIVNLSLCLNWHLNERNVNHHQISLQQKVIGGLNGEVKLYTNKKDLTIK